MVRPWATDQRGRQPKRTLWCLVDVAGALRIADLRVERTRGFESIVSRRRPFQRSRLGLSREWAVVMEARGHPTDSSSFPYDLLPEDWRIHCTHPYPCFGW